MGTPACLACLCLFLSAPHVEAFLCAAPGRLGSACRAIDAARNPGHGLPGPLAASKTSPAKSRAPAPASRSLRAPRLRLEMAVDTGDRVQKILPLYDGRNLIIGDNRWFLESPTGEDELFGDFAVPLEMDDEERGEFTEWILYRDGEVVTTVTEDEIDSENDPYVGVSTATLTNPIGNNLKTGASGFVLSTLASMIGLLGRGDEREKPSTAIGGDSGTGFRMFGSMFGLKERTSGEEDTTWVLWDVNRDRPAPTPPEGGGGGAEAAAAAAAGGAGAQKPASETSSSSSSPDAATAPSVDEGAAAAAAAGSLAPAAGEDGQWVAARREGKMLLREASATMKGGDFAVATETCKRAIALFEGEVARGVGQAAEDMLVRAFSEAKTASEADQKQADARAEAMRLSNEAEQWLRNGDLDNARILALRAQEALNEVEQFFGRVTAEELTRVLEVKVRVQEKQQMRLESGAVGAAEVTSSTKRAQLEARQRRKLVEKKKEDARRTRQGQVPANSKRQGDKEKQDASAGRGRAEGGEEDWRQVESSSVCKR